MYLAFHHLGNEDLDIWHWMLGMILALEIGYLVAAFVLCICYYDCMYISTTKKTPN